MVTANYKQITLKNKASSLKAYNYITSIQQPIGTCNVMISLKEPHDPKHILEELNLT